MAREPLVLSEIDGFPGWTWRALEREELPLAWPLARLAGVTGDLGGWLDLAGRWLAQAALEGGGLGALLNPTGLVVALERDRPRPSEEAAPGAIARASVLEVPWLVALEVTPQPRCHAALLQALAHRARARGFRAIRLARAGPSAEPLARLADRLGFEPAPEGWCWPLADRAEPAHPAPAARR